MLYVSQKEPGLEDVIVAVYDLSPNCFFHAHGQGRIDLTFLLPTTVAKIPTTAVTTLPTIAAKIPTIAATLPPLSPEQHQPPIPRSALRWKHR